MSTKRDIAKEQIELQLSIQISSSVNIVNCGNCGSTILHKMDSKDTLECFCGVMDKSDCPDLWHVGCENNSVFDETETESYDEISIEDIVQVALDLKLNPTIEQIKEVQKVYRDEADNDPTSNFKEVIEGCLYNVID